MKASIKKFLLLVGRDFQKVLFLVFCTLCSLFSQQANSSVKSQCQVLESDHAEQIREDKKHERLKPVIEEILKLAEVAKSEKDFLRLARFMEKNGFYQEAIWTYRDAGEFKRAESLNRKLEETLKSSEPSGKKVKLEGSTEVYLVEFKSDVSAVFKPIETDSYSFWASRPHHEVSAYRVDRVLGLDIVPVTVLRVIDGRLGSLQYYIRGSQKSREDDSLGPFNLLDYLIANGDRTGRNFIFGSDDMPVAIDHGISFGVKGYHHRAIKFKDMQFDIELKARIKKTDENVWREEVGPLLRENHHLIKSLPKDVLAETPELKAFRGDVHKDRQFELFIERYKRVQEYLAGEIP